MLINDEQAAQLKATIRSQGWAVFDALLKEKYDIEIENLLQPSAKKNEQIYTDHDMTRMICSLI